MIFGKKVNKKSLVVGDDFYEHYEAKLKKARDMAFITNVMYSLNWFLGFCILTWATAVILGGLLTDLSQHDYFSVVALLLLEALQLSTATFFGRFVTLRLIQGTADPRHLIYNDAPHQKLQGIACIIEQILQHTVVAVRILIPIRRLKDLAAAAAGNGFDGLTTSLRIFYVLVLVNGAIAGISVIFSKHVVPLIVDSSCLRKYYQKVVWTSMDEGLLHSRDFELLSWTFQMQADEYRRNQRPWVVMELYGDLIKFLYYHPRSKGFEAARVALESDDTFQREAAANIVGLWVRLVADPEVKDSAINDLADVEALKDPEKEKSKEKIALSRLLVQKKLMSKLAEAVDSDESGRAATYSFLMLVLTDPLAMLEVRSEGGKEMLADILMDRIHAAVVAKKPRKAIIDIKVLIPLLPSLMTDGNGGEPRKYCTQHKFEVLKKDMWTIVTDYASDLKRLQAVAAYAYFLLMTEVERKSTDLVTQLLEKPKDEGTYLLMDEFEYLLKVLWATETLPSCDWWKSEEMPPEWKGAVTKRDVKDESRKPLPWLARDSTALVASFVNVGILVVSSIYIMRYAHF